MEQLIQNGSAKLIHFGSTKILKFSSYYDIIKGLKLLSKKKYKESTMTKRFCAILIVFFLFVFHVSADNRPSGWSSTLWKTCWKSRGYLDFTDSAWDKLSCKQQNKMAKAYQTWYAKRIGVPVNRVFEVAKVKFKMVLIPPGKFWMGALKKEEGRDIDEYPRHKVLISKPFWICEHEITQGQWFNITQTKPWTVYAGKDDFKRPANYVSWDDIQVVFYSQAWQKVFFAHRSPVGIRLSFWMYAEIFIGEKTKGITKLENMLGMIKLLNDKGEEYAHSVGQKESNSWGLFDMSGNVWEWCLDSYDKYRKAEQVDPINLKKTLGKVGRGGSWNPGAKYCRAASRFWNPSNTSYVYLGFRIIRVLK